MKKMTTATTTTTTTAAATVVVNGQSCNCCQKCTKWWIAVRDLVSYRAPRFLRRCITSSSNDDGVHFPARFLFIVKQNQSARNQAELLRPQVPGPGKRWCQNRIFLLPADGIQEVCVVVEISRERELLLFLCGAKLSNSGHLRISIKVNSGSTLGRSW